MGKVSRMEYAKLDSIIEANGKDFIINSVITRIANGDDPRDIAHSLGIHYVYLKKWLEQECAEDIALAKRANADVLVGEALNEVRYADPDSLGVAKLRADTYMKIAEKQSKVEWGNAQGGSSGFGGVTIVIGAVDAPKFGVDISDAEIIDGK